MHNMSLESTRDYIINELKDSQQAIIKLSDTIQKQGLRICPRNIYNDKKSEAICVNPCRKRFATCFKKYFKEAE